jgi:hypothetical protein
VLISRLFACFLVFFFFFCLLFYFHCHFLLFYDPDFETSTTLTSSDSGRAFFSLHSPVTPSEEAASLTTAFSHAPDEVVVTLFQSPGFSAMPQSARSIEQIDDRHLAGHRATDYGALIELPNCLYESDALFLVSTSSCRSKMS